MSDQVRWEIDIRRDGMWPTVWTWKVWRKDGIHYSLRTGDAMTKNRARREAVKAKLSMERDDVTVTS